MQEEASFWHREFPSSCITPLVFTEPGLEAFPGIGSGTAFFASYGSEVFLITAQHCLQSNTPQLSAHHMVERLTVPFELNGTTSADGEIVVFRGMTQLALNETREDFLDVVVLHVRPQDPFRHQILKERAAKLPHNGMWLDQFVSTPLGSEALTKKVILPFVVMGYPNQGTSTHVRYADDEGEFPEVQTQAVIISGNLRWSALDHCLRLEDIHWPHGNEGFSGAPVFAKVGTQESPRYALAGMVICGSSNELNFIQVSSICRATEHALAPNFARASA